MANSLSVAQMNVLNSQRADIEKMALEGVSVTQLYRQLGFKTGCAIRRWLADKPELKKMLEENGKARRGHYIEGVGYAKTVDSRRRTPEKLSPVGS